MTAPPPQILVTIDPGKDGSGVAAFIGRDLYLTRYVLAAEAPFTLSVLNAIRCVCEKPQVYYGRGPGNAADLIDVAIAAGRMSAALPTTYVKPAEWKGQLPKKIHHERVLAALEKGGDLPVYDRCISQVRAALRHNVLDAIALGLRTLGRI